MRRVFLKSAQVSCERVVAERVAQLASGNLEGVEGLWGEKLQRTDQAGSKGAALATTGYKYIILLMH